MKIKFRSSLIAGSQFFIHFSSFCLFPSWWTHPKDKKYVSKASQLFISCLLNNEVRVCCKKMRKYELKSMDRVFLYPHSLEIPSSEVRVSNFALFFFIVDDFRHNVFEMRGCLCQLGVVAVRICFGTFKKIVSFE